MYILETDKVSVKYGEKTVLDSVTFSINQNDRVGVVGTNGAGKTTLFDVLSGENTNYTGNVFISKGKKIGYLKQMYSFSSEKTVLETATEVFSELIEKEKRLEDLQNKMDSGATEKLIEEFSRLQNEFLYCGGYEYKKRAKGCLINMGFDENMLCLPVNSLSGGQKTVLHLAVLLLEEPDILLLDEPTNHLDIKAIEWLEDKIGHIKSTVIIVSHDRFFLDKVTSKTLEIENSRAKLYPVSYTEYKERKKTDAEIQERHYKNQQKEIKRIEEFIAQQRRWNREKNIIAAESRQKALDRMVKIEKAENPQRKLSFDFTDAVESGNDVLKVKGLSKSYSEKVIFKDLSFEVKKGDRLCIIGSNGSGKSTLLQILAGNEIQSGGTFEFGYNVVMGYYDQNLKLDENLTVIEEVASESELGVSKLRALLDSFLFRGDDVFKKISVLSGGERARVAMARLLQKKINVLLLDEPTNHLDIDSCEALENAIENFSGTVIAVSHDRYFINRLANVILSFESGENGSKTVLFNGDYARFSEKDFSENADFQKNNAEELNEGAKNYLASKKEKQERQKFLRRKSVIEEKIKANEQILAEIEKKSLESASDYVKLQKLFEEKEKIISENDLLTEEWMEIDEKYPEE